MMRRLCIEGLALWSLAGGCGGGGSSASDADAGTGSDAAPPDAEPPTSDDLIDDAVGAGTLAAETGLVYHVFAAFGDTRLPAQYQGGRARGGTTTMLEVASQWNSLTPDTQAILEPFTLPPSAPGSWIELASAADPEKASSARTIEWSKARAQGGAVTVWAEARYPGEAALAQSIAAEIDATIWTKLTGSGDQEAGLATPFPDDGLANNGGDGSLDIYLVHQGTNGDYGSAPVYKDQAPAECGPWASYMLINTQVAVGNKLFPTVAHELTHVLQHAYVQKGNCGGQVLWWMEASATWAEDLVYPQRNSEQEYTHEVILHPDVALFKGSRLHWYAGYLLPFLVHRKYGDPKFVARSYSLAAGQSTLSAIDAALAAVDSKGFAGVFPELALRDWNQEPVVDYETWDHIALMAKVDDTVSIHTDTNRQPLDTKIAALAARYVQLTVSDAAVRRIQLANIGIGAGLPGEHVWVIPKIDGQYKDPEELGLLKEYCRERAEENVESLILVISNSDWANPDATLRDKLVEFSGSAAGCLRYSGTVDLHRTIMAGTGTTDITYHLEPTFSQSPLNEFLLDLTALSWSYHAHFEDSFCRTDSTASGSLFTGPPDMSDGGMFGLSPGFGGQPTQYFWSIDFGNGATLTSVSDCGSPGQDHTTTEPFGQITLGTDMSYDLAADGTAMGEDGSGLSWNLKP